VKAELMKRSNHLTDEDIMTAVKNDRIEMLAILFERHHVRLYNFLLRLTGNRAVSEDLVQEIFVRILKYRSSYRGESKFLFWVYQIARNVHRDHLRKTKKEIPLDEQWQEEAAPEIEPDQESEYQEDISILNQALEKLPLKKKEIIILSRFQNLKYREIAELLECSIESIKVNVHRAMKDLRKNYFELGGTT
jgi:RNA polymerase sigma-70 factor (ECF subfamily)